MKCSCTDWTPLALLLACACGQSGARDCEEYPTWIRYVAFGPGDAAAEISGLAGGDPIACEQDPGAGGFVLRYEDGALTTDTAAVQAAYVRRYDAWVYYELEAPEDNATLALVDAQSPNYDVRLWNPDSRIRVHIDSVFSPSHDLQIRFLDADGAVLAEALME